MLNEVEGVYFRKNFEFNKFFSQLCRKVENHDDFVFLSRADLHNYINDINDLGKLYATNMHYAFEKIWEKFEFGENQDAFMIKLKLNEFISNFEGNNNLRRDKILNELILIPNHRKKDRKILNIIDKENLREELLHEDDENILFDANEFACSNPDLNLGFVTGDEYFLKAIDILMDYLCIEECTNIRKFSNN